MEEYFIETLNSILNLQNISNQEKVSRIKKTDIDEYLNKRFNDAQLIDLLNPLLLLTTKNELVYKEIVEQILNINIDEYLESIQSIDKEYIIVTVEDYIDLFNNRSKIHKYMAKTYLDNERKTGLLKPIKHNINISNKILIEGLYKQNKTILKTIIKSIKCLDTEDNKIIYLLEYLKKNNKKYVISKNKYKKYKEFKITNVLISKLSRFNNIKFKIIESNKIYLSLKKEIIKESFLINQTVKIYQNKYIDENAYLSIKNKYIINKDEEFYLKNNNYFEIEIKSNIYAYQKIVEELKEDYRINRREIEKIEQKIKLEKLKRCTKSYNEVKYEFNNFKNLNNNLFNYEYKNGYKKTLQELVKSKSMFLDGITNDILKFDSNELRKFKEEKKDCEFYNSLILDNIISLSNDEAEFNMMVMDTKELRTLKEALFYGKLKYLDNLSTISENKLETYQNTKIDHNEAIIYTRGIIKKISELNAILDKNLNKYFLDQRRI
ncbi:MAG: hypothetical protein RR923_06335 [Bacilli bacterium]